MKRLGIIAALVLAGPVSGCAPVAPLGDPCTAADRPVTLSNLLENSMSNSYEACLTRVRAEAVAALGE